MDVAELLDIALAGAPRDRVDIATLEPADIAMEAVSGLAQLVAELVDNAVAFSEPGQTVRVTGFFTRDDYLITVSDQGLGIPESMMIALNRVLEDPGAITDEPTPKMGIQLVARLASRLGVGVRLVPAMPGTTARIVVPGRLVRQEGGAAPQVPPTEEPAPFAPEPIAAEPEAVPMVPRRRSLDPFRHEITMGDEARDVAEAFLDRVFGPLVGKPRNGERPVRRPSLANEQRPVRQPSRPDRDEAVPSTARLRVRVPGVNFTLIEDEPSTAAAERAIDIRSALTDYQQGKRSAEEQAAP